MKKRKVALIAAAAVAVTLSLINASWIAPKPSGKLILIAHRGVAQQFSREGLGRQDCTARRIRPPEHPFIENTIPSISRAFFLGADAVEIDVQQTKDGRMVAFHDALLECRTDGKGPVRDHTLAELKRLDVGYGYTADGGRTFPLRGRIGGIPTVEEVLQAVPRQQLIFHFKSADPADADALAAAFARAGPALDGRYAFYGDDAAIARIRRHAPEAWTWTSRSVKACGAAYFKWGWSGFTPAACEGATIMVPLNYGWAAWGWPNRFLARMADRQARTVLIGDLGNFAAPVGIERTEQLARVPRDYRGYLWVEEIYKVGPALRR